MENRIGVIVTCKLTNVEDLERNFGNQWCKTYSGENIALKVTKRYSINCEECVVRFRVCFILSNIFLIPPHFSHLCC